MATYREGIRVSLQLCSTLAYGEREIYNIRNLTEVEYVVINNRVNNCYKRKVLAIVQKTSEERLLEISTPGWKLGYYYITERILSRNFLPGTRA